jgi:CHASE1-domain containing sensor protein
VVTLYGRLRKSGLSKLAWASLFISALLVVFGSLPIKIIFACLLAMHPAALLLARGQFVEVGSRCVRIRGFGPAIKIRYDEIQEVREASDDLPLSARLLTMLAQPSAPGFQPFKSNTEITLARRKWVLFFTPLPFIWLSKKIRLPILDGPSFVADVTTRLREAAR